MTLLYHYFFKTYLAESFLSSLFICFFISQQSWEWGKIALLFLGLLLSFFDLKTQTYPLLIWLIFTGLIAYVHPINSLTLVLVALAVLSYMGWIKIGEGDFLYLASSSLLLSLNELLWMIQIASLLGLAYFWISKPPKKTIAFIPFLYLGLAIVLFIDMITK
ncbi:prepilin peptidase [Streptococcus saliviloxodontae]|uniref:Prepilin signal peptidase PulO-like enzyme (Type II secretory pathway) n=1 Tax=Streptococcus saliviloxodontae TaxID=1349416 RepID=A0ABS2PJG6_9STRE|nr:prepilin peptidase [Streptococcus saliviloxodontae]MBM7635417.1 prepilin signal peptidase PulO-like enzyme (type II secretory pathway) [Streptococcus saliviloxodontae]